MKFLSVSVAEIARREVATAVRRTFLKWFKYHPWLRSLALVHYGNSIFMVKRAVPREIAV